MSRYRARQRGGSGAIRDRERLPTRPRSRGGACEASRGPPASSLNDRRRLGAATLIRQKQALDATGVRSSGASRSRPGRPQGVRHAARAAVLRCAWQSRVGRRVYRGACSARRCASCRPLPLAARLGRAQPVHSVATDVESRAGRIGFRALRARAGAWRVGGRCPAGAQVSGHSRRRSRSGHRAARRAPRADLRLQRAATRPRRCCCACPEAR